MAFGKMELGKFSRNQRNFIICWIKEDQIVTAIDAVWY